MKRYLHLTLFILVLIAGFIGRFLTQSKMKKKTLYSVEIIKPMKEKTFLLTLTKTGRRQL